MNIDHLKDKFDLNELEVSLLEYIKKNQKQLKNITIRQMAKDNFTSTSAIYRLCNKLEFSGYSDMIYHLSSNTHNNAPAQKYENYLPHFIQLLNKHKTLNGFCTMSVVHMEMLDASFQDSTFLIVISNSGITTRLEEVVETAKNNHIDIITFTGNEKSKISQYSTLPIIIGHYNPFYHDNLVPNAFFGQVLIIFESLLYSFLSSKK